MEGVFTIAKNLALGVIRRHYLPTGRIDFLSVDELARLHANMSAQFDDEKF